VHEIARHCGLKKPSSAPHTASTLPTSPNPTSTNPSSPFQTAEAHPKPSHSHSPAAWFLTLNHSAHPNCTDAPLIEPLLLRLATGAKIDAAKGVRAYVDASEAFVRYAIGGEGWYEGILGEREGEAEEEEAVHGLEFGSDGASSDAIKNEMKKTTTKTANADGNDTWRVHVAPNWTRCGRAAPG